MATDTMDVRGASERIQCLPHEAPVAAILISGLVLAVSVTTSLLWQPSIRGYPSLVWALALIPALLLSYYKSWRGSLIILVVATVLLAAADVGRQLSASLTTWELVGVLVIVLLAVSLGAGFVSDARRLNALNALKSANVDAETGLPNQLVFNIALEKEFAALSWGRTFSVALIEVDGVEPDDGNLGVEEDSHSLHTRSPPRRGTAPRRRVLQAGRLRYCG
jgi:predicted signal transduction protein with EAL and GGDEF domain